MKKGIICILIFMLFFASNMLVIGQRTENLTIDDADDYESLTIGKAWMKTFGGIDYDSGSAIQKTSDDGYIIVGSTDNYGIGGHDVWVIKTDMNGDEVWNKTYGTTDNSTTTERGTSVVQTTDNGYMITAKIGNDLWLIKTNENGTEEWIKIYSKNTGYSICQSDDECFVISGYNSTSRSLWILKVDNSGNEIWYNNFEEISSYGLSIKQTSDHGYIIGGYSCIVKTDENGTEKWQVILSDDMFCRDVLQSNDGTFAAIGWMGVWTKNNSGWFMKIDTNGNTLSIKKYGGVFNRYKLNRFHQTSDGGYIVIGEIDREIEPWGVLHLKLCIIKTNEDGRILWKRIYGSGFSYDFGIDIKELSDGGYIVLGGTNSYGAGSVDIWLIKTDANGKVPLLYRLLNLFPKLKNILV